MKPTSSPPNITIPVDLTNPGQFFACCGLLELADRLWPGAEGWFAGSRFHIRAGDWEDLWAEIVGFSVCNCMSQDQLDTMDRLAAYRETRPLTPTESQEEDLLNGLRRKSPIVLSGPVSLRVDWFCDRFGRGFTLKTWAGNQSVLTIASDMHSGLKTLPRRSPESIWTAVSGIGLPFNFDGELGAEGGGRDVGFVFNSFKNKRGGITRQCRPALEFLAFVGLQRFRPLEMPSGDRFRFATWRTPHSTATAPAFASTTILEPQSQAFEFQMFNTSKDYYTFYPAQPLMRSIL